MSAPARRTRPSSRGEHAAWRRESAASPPLAPPPAGLWLALAAGRLLLRRGDDPGLRRIAASHLATDGADALAAAVAAGADTLFEQLATAPAATPLARIANTFRLSGFDLDLLALAVLPCFDEDAAASVCALSGGARRLSVGTALAVLFGAHADPSAVRAALHDSPLWRGGLLRADDSGHAVLERRLDPSSALLAGLDGRIPADAGAGWRARVLAPPSVAGAGLRAAAAALAAARTACAHLCGPPGRAEAALAMAAGDAPAVVLDAPDEHAPPPWAEAALIHVATGARVALRTDAARLAAPQGVAPVAVIAPAGLVLHGTAAPLHRIDAGGADPLELADAWQAALGCSQAEADELAGRNWIDDATPARLAAGLPAGGGAAAALAGLGCLSPPQAPRMATRTMPAVPWERLVLPAGTRARLDDLVRRVRRRVTVQLRWGMACGGRGRAVVGLLYGESGTGKTLAAEALATRLQMPMLSVDLSLVVSKYIGETEKNLAELFAAAEGYAALLFFDEADALFGRRTNVQDAHDRYANIEVNYLLQRLESFEGCALLATNLMQGVDDAFMRRIDQVVHFPRPGPAERLTLWRTHLPARRLAADVALEQLAARFELTGGEIRNAALAAAFVAADEDVEVNAAIIDAAVAETFTKLGRPFPCRQGA